MTAHSKAKSVRVVNLTGHPVVWQDRELAPLPADDARRRRVRAGLRIRQAKRTIAPGLVEVRRTWPSFLPPLEPLTLYVVSGVTRRSLSWRPDLISPANHEVRSGKVVASRSLEGNAGMGWYIRRSWEHTVMASTLAEAIEKAQNTALLVLWVGGHGETPEGVIAVPQAEWIVYLTAPNPFPSRLLFPRGQEIAYARAG